MANKWTAQEKYEIRKLENGLLIPHEDISKYQNFDSVKEALEYIADNEIQDQLVILLIPSMILTEYLEKQF